MRRHSALLLVVLTAACAPQAPAPTLPTTLAARGGDPVVPVGQDMVAFFRNPQPNRPAEAARAIADLEWMADSLPRNPRWNQASSVGLNGLQQARWEARRAARHSGTRARRRRSSTAWPRRRRPSRRMTRRRWPVPCRAASSRSGRRRWCAACRCRRRCRGVVSAYESVATDRVQGMVH